MAKRNREICSRRNSNLQNVSERSFFCHFQSQIDHLYNACSVSHAYTYNIFASRFYGLDGFKRAAIVLGHYRFVHVVHFMFACRLPNLMPRDWFNLIFALDETYPTCI